jgi:DNA polymerase-3 subunit delta
VDLSLTQLRSKLGKGLRGGSFYLHGSDAFLKAEALDVVVEAHLAGADRSFNLDLFRGDAVAVEALTAALATPPVLSSHRVVVLRDAQDAPPSVRSALEHVLDRLPPDLAFVVTAEVPKGSSAKWYDRLKRAGVAVRCEPPAESALPGWLMERARSAHGVELDPAAATLLSSYLGRALGPLVEELAKLADYVAPRTRIDADDVRAVVGALPQRTRYARCVRCWTAGRAASASSRRSAMGC